MVEVLGMKHVEGTEKKGEPYTFDHTEGKRHEDGAGHQQGGRLSSVLVQVTPSSIRHNNKNKRGLEIDENMTILEEVSRPKDIGPLTLSGVKVIETEELNLGLGENSLSMLGENINHQEEHVHVMD